MIAIRTREAKDAHIAFEGQQTLNGDTYSGLQLTSLPWYVTVPRTVESERSGTNATSVSSTHSAFSAQIFNRRSTIGEEWGLG